MSFNFSSDSFSPSVSNDTIHIEPPLESATTQWPRTQSTMAHSQVTNHPSPDSLSPALTQQAHTADISCSVNPLFIDTLAKEHGLTEEKYHHHLHFFAKVRPTCLETFALTIKILGRIGWQRLNTS